MANKGNKDKKREAQKKPTLTPKEKRKLKKEKKLKLKDTMDGVVYEKVYFENSKDEFSLVHGDITLFKNGDEWKEVKPQHNSDDD